MRIATTVRGTPARRTVLVALTATMMLGLIGLGGCQSNRPRDDRHWFARIIPSSPTAGEAARDAFNVYSADRRREAVDQIAAAPYGGERAYLRMYRLLIDDPDAAVRASCAKALGLHGTGEDVTLIAPLLRDDHAFVRWEAAKALQRIHNPTAADALRSALQADDDSDVRQAAAAALGQYPSTAVLHTLVGALHDTEYSVTRAAHRSLQTLTGRDLGYEAADWLAWIDREASAELFADRDDYTFRPYLAPPSFIERMQFWRNHPTAADPRKPVGMQPEHDAERG
ncbi:MAG: HEAT repeat domain-containing protein [Phycisphaeraceae bacterium]